MSSEEKEKEESQGTPLQDDNGTPLQDDNINQDKEQLPVDRHDQTNNHTVKTKWERHKDRSSSDENNEQEEEESFEQTVAEN
jgi:protein required for attachment to host cells